MAEGSFGLGLGLIKDKSPQLGAETSLPALALLFRPPHPTPKQDRTWHLALNY